MVVGSSAYKEVTALDHRHPKDQEKLLLFDTDNPNEKRTPDYTHVCVVTWTDDVLSILAQAPVHGSDRSRGRKVLFVNHKVGKVAVMEAIGIAKKISEENSGTGSSGLIVLA